VRQRRRWRQFARTRENGLSYYRARAASAAPHPQSKHGPASAPQIPRFHFTPSWIRVVCVRVRVCVCVTTTKNRETKEEND
jgi:hypothetical protein